MKVFIVSDNKRNSIALANMINASGNIGIISEGDASEPQQIAAELEAHRDSFRLAFVVTDKPIYACAEANKSDRMRAAVCNNVRDVEEAKEAMANVLVLRNSAFQKLGLGEMISTCTGKDIPRAGGMQDSLSAKHSLQKQGKKQRRQQEQDSDGPDEDMEEESQGQSGSKGHGGKATGGGIFGKLKSSLGIEE